MTFQPNPGSFFPTPASVPSLDDILSGISQKYIEQKIQDAAWIAAGDIGKEAKAQAQLALSVASAQQMQESAQAMANRQQANQLTLSQIESPLPKIPDIAATTPPS